MTVGQGAGQHGRKGIGVCARAIVYALIQPLDTGTPGAPDADGRGMHLRYSGNTVPERQYATLQNQGFRPLSGAHRPGPAPLRGSRVRSWWSFDAMGRGSLRFAARTPGGGGRGGDWKVRLFCTGHYTDLTRTKCRLTAHPDDEGRQGHTYRPRRARRPARRRLRGPCSRPRRAGAALCSSPASTSPASRCSRGGS